MRAHLPTEKRIYNAVVSQLVLRPGLGGEVNVVRPVALGSLDVRLGRDAVHVLLQPVEEPLDELVRVLLLQPSVHGVLPRDLLLDRRGRHRSRLAQPQLLQQLLVPPRQPASGAVPRAAVEVGLERPREEVAGERGDVTEALQPAAQEAGVAQVVETDPAPPVEPQDSPEGRAGQSLVPEGRRAPPLVEGPVRPLALRRAVVHCAAALAPARRPPPADEALLILAGAVAAVATRGELSRPDQEAALGGTGLARRGGEGEGAVKQPGHPRHGRPTPEPLPQRAPGRGQHRDPLLRPRGRVQQGRVVDGREGGVARVGPEAAPPVGREQEVDPVGDELTDLGFYLQERPFPRSIRAGSVDSTACDGRVKGRRLGGGGEAQEDGAAPALRDGPALGLEVHSRRDRLAGPSPIYGLLYLWKLWTMDKWESA